VKTTSSYSSGHTGYTYRLEAVLTNGKTVRFRWYSTGDGRVKKQQATRLRSALGLVHTHKPGEAGESDGVAETN